MSGAVRVQCEGHVLELVLDNPERRNAVSGAMLAALRDALSEHATQDVRAVLLMGAGERAFCAGYDLTALPQNDDPDGPDFGGALALGEAAAALEAFPAPVIAVLRGACMGAGGELATACDLRWAGDDLKFAMPPAKLGLVYSETGLQRFLALVGPAATKELFYTAAPVDAARAVAMGLLNRVVPAGELLAAARSLAADIARNAPLSLRGHKRVLQLLAERPLDAEAQAEIATLRLSAFQSEDYREGVAAVLSKRTPEFHGR